MTEKSPAQFARHRTSTEVVELARQKGYRFSTEKYNLGSDYITVELPGPSGELVAVLYSVVNGRFFHVARGAGISFGSDKTEHDGEPWFNAMLDFFYVPKDEK